MVSINYVDEDHRQPVSITSQANPLPRATIWGVDTDLIAKMMDEDADRLFTVDLDNVELWEMNFGGLNTIGVGFSRLDGEDISNYKVFSGNPDAVQKELSNHWQTPTRPNQETFYILRQSYTWARLNLTRQTFQTILDRHQVFPFFLETVHAFGARIKDDISSCSNYHSRWSEERPGVKKHLEISYTVRFFELNNRGRGDPWSLRQTGVYSKSKGGCLDEACHQHQSTWILIQPSAGIEKRLKVIFEQITGNGLLWKYSHIFFHLAILGASFANWRKYCESLGSLLEELEEKTSFSTVDYHDKNDYELRFSDLQKLHKLRRKLFKASRLLAASTHLLHTVNQRLVCEDEDLDKSSPDLGNNFLRELDDFETDAKDQQSLLEELLHRANDACDLLKGILQYRQATLTLKNVDTSAQSLGSLVQISEQGKVDGKVAQQTSVKSASLTFVATLYLPASLVSAIFSSNLVSVADDGHFVIASDFWKFIVILIAMTAVTFAIITSSEMFWMRSYKRRTERMAAKNVMGGAP